MKRCPKCNKDFPDDANFCPVDAGQLAPIDASEAVPAAVPRIDTGGNELIAGRFAVGDIIGGRRSGPVYMAGDKQGTSAIVKIVDPKVFPSALLKQRTERELKQLERLDHPGVAKILGHGRREDALWIAMELVDGIPLSRFVSENGPLPQPRVLGIVSQIGAALEAAAKLGVTHRDLAPKNILIGEGDRVKLINFGVPLPAEAGANETVQGVLEYVAPEQVEGRPVDQRCNIYSLGAIAYTLLTGAAPFTGTPSEVLAGHRSGELRPLGAAEGVSAELNTVLAKALEKTSSKRFMTLRQFLGDLQKTEGTQAAAAPAATPAAGKAPPSAGDMNKTLMGVAPGEIQALLAAQAAGKAVGTPSPEQATAAPASGGGRDSMAATSLDHQAPNMAQHEAAQAAAAAQAQAAAEQAATLSHPSIPDDAATNNPQAAAAPQAAQAAAQFSPSAPTVANQPKGYPATAFEQAAAPAAPVAPAMAHPAPAPAMAQPAPEPAMAQPAPAAAKVPAGGKRKGGKSKSPPVKEKPGSKGKFRETMWFKKGELDEAAARAAAQAKPEAGVSAKADEMEMDERYSDDGSITQQDQERLSLRTGATMMMDSVNPGQPAPRGQVSEDYLVSEMTEGRNKILLILGVAVVVVGLALFLIIR
jgi:serine/threonine-protein kinase